MTASLVSGLGFLLSSAAALRAVSVAYLGGQPDWRESLRAVWSRFGSLVWLGLLMVVGLTIAFILLVIPFIWLAVAWSLALAPQVSARTSHVLLPEQWHAPLRQRMVLTRRAGPTAARFYDWLQTDAAREVFARYGFHLPEMEG